MIGPTNDCVQPCPVFTLNKNIKGNTFVFAPICHELKDLRLFLRTQRAFFLKYFSKMSVKICISKYFSTIECHSKMCSFTVLGGGSENQSVYSVPTICLTRCYTSPSHRVD